MVCEWGMSDALGPVTFGKEDRQIFLGREMSRTKEYSEATAVLIDQEIRSLIEWAMARARKLLSENPDKLHLLATNLLERETLTGSDLDSLFGRTPAAEATPPSEAGAPPPSDAPEGDGASPAPDPARPGTDEDHEPKAVREDRRTG
jgi:cell division protease FtsH